VKERKGREQNGRKEVRWRKEGRKERKEVR
jgi:hypothetical protein